MFGRVSHFRNGYGRAGSRRMIHGDGFSGIADTSWDDVSRVRMLGRSRGGARCHGISRRYGRIADRGIYSADRSKDRRFSIGRMIVEKYENNQYRDYRFHCNHFLLFLEARISNVQLPIENFGKRNGDANSCIGAREVRGRSCGH